MDSGAPGGTRTPGLLIRSQSLYPSELRARGSIVSSNYPGDSRREQRPPGTGGRDIKVTETEIKLRWDGSAASARAHIEAHGYRAVGPRTLEADQLFDRASGELRRAGQILRLRTSGGKSTATFKGPAEAGPYKSREEIEFDVGDAAAFEEVLARLGYQRAFRYEKYRTKFAAGRQEGQGSAEGERGEGPAGEQGIVTLDETPIGVFMELEGLKSWIDATAKHLGFGRDSYLTASYAALYGAHKAAHPEAPADMVFVRNSFTLP